MGISTKKGIKQKILDASGIRLDIGCGAGKQPGFIGIDYRALPGVDIVHNIEETPWPLEDESVLVAVSSHVLEHINPHAGVFMGVMDEVWRVLKDDGEFAFAVPYAGSPGYWQDPTHCNGITEATIYYFDPLHESGLYSIYEPKPWKIKHLTYTQQGNLECVLIKRKEDPSYGN